MSRRISKKIKVGNIYIGGDAPISVQSMTNRPAHDFDGTLEQVKRLADAGCDIVRMAVPDENAAPVCAASVSASVTPTGPDTASLPYLPLTRS